MIWITIGSLVGLVVVSFIVQEIVDRRKMARLIERALTNSHDLVRQIIKESGGMEANEQEVADDQGR